MREQRWSMVRKQIQYSFIYEYLERWIRNAYPDYFQDNRSISAKSDNDNDNENENDPNWAHYRNSNW